MAIFPGRRPLRRSAPRHHGRPARIRRGAGAFPSSRGALCRATGAYSSPLSEHCMVPSLTSRVSVAGGYLARRMRSPWTAGDGIEQQFRDGSQGFGLGAGCGAGRRARPVGLKRRAEDVLRSDDGRCCCLNRRRTARPTAGQAVARVAIQPRTLPWIACLPRHPVPRASRSLPAPIWPSRSRVASSPIWATRRSTRATALTLRS